MSETTKLTILRHISDLAAQETEEFPYFFDEKEANKAIGFLRALRHPSGRKGIAGELFKVQDNQAFITVCIFGWRRKRSGLMRFTEVYLEVSRKWGKSLYAGFMKIYKGFYSGATGAGAFTAATTRDQADEVFRAAQGMARLLRQDSDKARRSIRVMANSINDADSGCFIQKVSADAGNLDGKNPICVILDERHAHPNDAVKEVMESGMGTWDDPLLVSITTAGFNKLGPCYTVDRPNAISVLKGEKRQDSLFAMIFTHDTDDADGVLELDPDIPEQAEKIVRLAKKSNPNLGSTPTVDWLLDRVRKARNKGGTTRVGVLTKNFNCWVDAPVIWIPDEVVKSVMRPISRRYEDGSWRIMEEYEGRPSFIGLDLAATSDIAACAHFFPKHGDLPAALHLTYWLPEATIEKKKDDANYAQWVADGFLQTTPGNVTDYAYIRSEIKRRGEVHNIQGITLDPWQGYNLMTQLVEDGFDPRIMRQTFLNVGPSTYWLERSILSDETIIEIDQNPITAWMFQNVTLAKNAEGAIRPDKDKSQNKIDGISASVTAIAQWLGEEPPVTSYLLDEGAELIKW